jgi:murein DD-endopeptidase MepM/ murein hydrolase activator NlpD
MVRLGLALFAVAAVACGVASGSDGASTSRVVTELATSAAAATPSPTPEVTPAPRRPKPKPAVAIAASDPRDVPFARVSGVALVHPSEEVVRVGFHQSSDLANRNMTPARTAARGVTLPSRGRATSRHTAADIAVQPRADIYAPVTGVVKRAGDYRLYCKYQDAFVIISPDGHPELEVKILHISGRRVRAGDRVVAGETRIASRPTKFPFSSQIDAFTSVPFPHVHIEVTKLAVPSAVPQPNAGLKFGC